MLIQASNIPAALDALLPQNESQLKHEVASALNVKASQVKSVHVTRKAVDARKKSNVHFVLSVTANVDGLEDVSKLRPQKGVQVQLHFPKRGVQFPSLDDVTDEPSYLRPIVVGAGPAGLFCALALAYAGARPLLIERGKPVEERMRDVRAFANGGALNQQSNIQFGEGGAGTFSDGKLTTGTKSPFARFVREEFVECGAPEDILVDAKPHIGTDYLPNVVRNLRERIIEAGGEVRFQTQLVGVSDGEDAYACARVQDLETGNEEDLLTNALVLACGHSARDTFQMLHDAGVEMRRKPFAMGVRIEHSQRMIDEAQYGKAAGHPALAPADYKLAHHNADGRGVYTFCMCPGGEVVAAASEEGGVCVNGMSSHARDGRNANAALLVEVRPEDLPEEDGALAGMHLQRELERAAFRAGGEDYTAPAQTVGDFLSGISAAGVEPTYPRGVRSADLHDIFPPFMTEALEEALPKLGKKLHGFDAPEALMTAVEARSSSPVRMERNEGLQSVSHPGIYPAGEGAGHAGGIMSAACDGMRVAFAIMDELLVLAAANALKQGRPAVFPTDTVVGVGVSVATAPDAHELAHIKGRDEGKPVAWLVDSPDALDAYGKDVPAYAHELAREGWPGALTLVVKASDAVPEAFQSEAGTIGLRMLASSVVRRLIAHTGAPLATTSANLAGEEAPLCMDHVSAAFSERAQGADTFFLDLPDQGTGTASTVIDCTGPEPITLR